MFIVLEGIDGSGKSTLARAIARRLGARAHVLTREPTDSSPWGQRLRASEREGRLPRTEETEHFHKDRLAHIAEVIRPALAAGKIVLCDRYVDSTLAYQSDSPEAAAALFETMKAELIAPDLVLILDCPVEVALERIAAARGGATSFERAETLRRAAAIYASRRLPYHVHLDGAQDPGLVEAAAWRIIAARLKEGPGDGGAATR